MIRTEDVKTRNKKRTNSRDTQIRALKAGSQRSARHWPLKRELDYERSFQLSAWMMLPSLYAHVIFS
jgi:hypothetical protein